MTTRRNAHPLNAVVRKKPPWVFQPSEDRYETARYLLLHCGYPYDCDLATALTLARAALDEAAERLKGPSNRPEMNDTAAAWMVRAIQRSTKCKKRKAMLWVVDRYTGCSLRRVEGVERFVPTVSVKELADAIRHATRCSEAEAFRRAREQTQQIKENAAIAKRMFERLRKKLRTTPEPADAGTLSPLIGVGK
jgi:hypothetical protein